MFWFEVMGVICFFVGVAALRKYRSASQKNFVFCRAPKMSISSLHVFDDAWISGAVEAPEHIISPFFSHACIYYSYTLEERQVKHVKDANGRVRREVTWVQIESSSDSRPFFIKDDTGQLAIDPSKAVIECPLSDSSSDGQHRHRLEYLPASGELSALGVVSDDKWRLLGKDEIPLTITPLEQEKFIQYLKSMENGDKSRAFLMFWFSS